MKTILMVLVFSVFVFGQSKQDSVVLLAKKQIQNNLKIIQSLKEDNIRLSGLIIAYTTKPEKLLKQLKPKAKK